MPREPLHHRVPVMEPGLEEVGLRFILTRHRLQASKARNAAHFVYTAWNRAVKAARGRGWTRAAFISAVDLLWSHHGGDVDKMERLLELYTNPAGPDEETNRIARG